jgi:histidinol phosphatase-like enzyme
MNKVVYFDMDGTIADLYGVSNVFNRLDNLDASVYYEAKPINKYIDMLKEFHNMGYKVIILSCLGMISDKQFDKDTIYNKGIWLDKYVGKEYIDERIYIPNTKHKETYTNMYGNGILVDDDDRVLINWKYDRIKAINDNKAIK